MALGGFGVTEFQLVLLRRMQDFQPELVEQAWERLGVDRSDARRANAFWQSTERSRRAPRGLDRYRIALGAPVGESEVRIGDLRGRLFHWFLPLWPDLRWEVLTGASGSVVNGWLARERGGAVPPLPADGDLEPWSCVIGDVEQTYADVKHLEGDAPSRWHMAYTTPTGSARLARFVYGLVQTTEVRDSRGAPARARSPRTAP
ncbi:hypothetical protein [Jiangella anatolica]|uniref:Uncharacterized protein n=1 Tax=Jiangella anatolica TaxID=2670374 RepID=A0A2W2BJV2_9ACTN|nr:hypothetical protein [Jiangella anatolica]PZF80624.1 hypothetical protein C1I92_25145 [Jiangella anatolica]